MYSGNFRILIFIDLLATAMGGSLILMMILSVSSKSSSAPAGSAREFIHYKVHAEDTTAYLQIIVKNGDDAEWLEGIIPEVINTAQDVFMINKQSDAVFAWGPTLEYDSANRVTRNVYNAYCTATGTGTWIMGVLFYNDQNLNEGKPFDPNKKIAIHHSIRTLDGIPRDTTSYVSLGNYSFNVVNIKMDPR